MNIGNWLEERPGDNARSFEQFAKVPVQELGELAFQISGHVSLSQKQIGKHVVAEPVALHSRRFVVQLVRRERGIGSQEIEMKVRVPGHVLHDAGHSELVEVVSRNHLSDRVLVPEVLVSHGLGQHHGTWFGQGRLRVSLDERYGKNVKYGRIREHEVPLVESILLVPDEPAGAGWLQPGNLLDLGEFLRHHRGPGRRRDRRLDRPSRYGGGFRQAVDPVMLLMISIIAEFVLHVKQDENAAGDADGQPQHVDRRIAFIPEQVSYADGEVVSEHERGRYVVALSQKSWLVHSGSIRL